MCIYVCMCMCMCVCMCMCMCVCMCVNSLRFHKEAEDIPDEVFEGRVIGSPCWTRREMRTF